MTVAEAPRICIYCGEDIEWLEVFHSWRHRITQSFMCRTTLATPATNPLEEWSQQDWNDFFDGLREDPR